MLLRHLFPEQFYEDLDVKKNNKRLIGTSVLMVAALAFGQTAWAEDQIYLSGNDNRTINSSVDTYSVVLTGNSNLTVSGSLNVLLDPENEDNYSKYGPYYSANSHIGDGIGSNSTATVFGQWDNYFNLFVGSNGGRGTLNVNGSGYVTTGNSGHVGSADGSTGVANVTGSWGAAEGFWIGGGGTGTLNVKDGGRAWGNNFVNVGRNGVVNIDGKSSELTTQKVELINGGELIVSNGGSVGRETSVFAGNYVDLSINNSPFYSDSSISTAVIKGEGSSWIGSDINIGSGNTGDGTEPKNAALIVKDGGAMFADQMTIGNSGILSMMTGGQLTSSGPVTNRGVISLNDSLIEGNVTNHGVLLGDQGTIDGNVTNYGLISPGNSPGVLTITGDLILEEGGTLLMEIFGPTAYDQLIIGGDFVAGGILELDFGGGYVPEFDVPYDLFQVAGGISGNFSEIRYLNLDGEFDTELLSLDFSDGMFRLIVGSNDDPVIPGDPGNNTVPEPSSGLLIALGGLVMLMLRRRSSVTGSLA